jgi:catalase
MPPSRHLVRALISAALAAGGMSAVFSARALAPAASAAESAASAVASGVVAPVAASPPAPAAAPASTPATPFPTAIVTTLNQLSGGPHAGFRANHAKGVLVSGMFAPAKGARWFCKAPRFAKAVPVLVRFSNATGVPTMPDADANAYPHGMAIRFQLPRNTTTDIVSMSSNGFPVATPDEFLGLLEAVANSGPAAAKPSPIDTFLGSHPAAAKWVSEPRPAPDSFGTLAFYGVNAFKFTNAKGVSHYARHHILPVAGEHALDAVAAAKAAPNYLMDELPRRIAKAPVQFRLVAQIAEAGDSTTDPTAVWPAERKRVELGTLSLSRTYMEQVKSQQALVFNPLALAAGIEPSADPILLARSSAYAVSFSQRAK